MLDLQQARQAHGADPNSEAPPKFLFLENGVGSTTAPNVDRPGDSGLHRRQEGRLGDAQGHAPRRARRCCFICLIHPWMQAKVDRHARTAALRRRALVGGLALAGAVGLLTAAPGRRARARLLGRRRADDVEHRAQRARRDHGHGRRRGRRGVPDRRLPPLHARAGGAPWRNAPRAERRRAARSPGPLLHARVGDRLRVHFKNLDTLRHDAALDALPRRRTTSRARTAPTCPGSPGATPRSSRASPGPTG